jgi:hypothetical protein
MSPTIGVLSSRLVDGEEDAGKRDLRETRLN